MAISDFGSFSRASTSACTLDQAPVLAGLRLVALAGYPARCSSFSICSTPGLELSEGGACWVSRYIPLATDPSWCSTFGGISVTAVSMGTFLGVIPFAASALRNGTGSCRMIPIDFGLAWPTCAAIGA